jgi:hydrogenase 3 maturation protease
VRCSDSPGFEAALGGRLSGARRLAVVGVGDEVNPHDRLGILAAGRIGCLNLPGVQVFLAGTMPETITAPVRRAEPSHILFIDSAAMEKPPGTLGIIDACDVHGRLLITHALPLPVVMEYLEKEAKAPATLVGIQPDLSASGGKPTPAEEQGIARLVQLVEGLVRGQEAS